MILLHDIRIYDLFTYAKDNWAQKAKKYFWSAEFTSKYPIHGLKYESFAREKYIRQEAVNNVWEFGLIVARNEPWLAYSPDGIVKSSESVTSCDNNKYFNTNFELFIICIQFSAGDRWVTERDPQRGDRGIPGDPPRSL